jgi:hypothetical protein
METERMTVQLEQLKDSIKLLLENGLVIPTLIMQYSAIEIVGWLDNDNPKAKTSEIFINWAKKYLVTDNRVPCSAEDLYGARCGLVHTMTPKSNMSKKKQARQIGYAYGQAKSVKLRNLHDAQGKSGEATAINIEALYSAWMDGKARWQREVMADTPRALRVLQRSEEFFLMVPLDHPNLNKELRE